VAWFLAAIVCVCEGVCDLKGLACRWVGTLGLDGKKLMYVPTDLIEVLTCPETSRHSRGAPAA